MRIFLTGPPGIGKTTLIQKLYEWYAQRGVNVSGMVTEEARTDNSRTGFRIRSLASGEEGWLAKKSTEPGPRIGSYTVNTPQLESIGAASLQSAARGTAPLVLIDEIGPMEMTSLVFRSALAEVLASGKTTVASVKRGSHYSEVERFSGLEGTRTYELSMSNRDSLPSELTALIDATIFQ